MRALSVKQVASCETAKSKMCRCRCGGKLHGAARLNPEMAGRAREFFETIPESDPHHLPTQEETKQKRKLARQRTKNQFQYRIFTE